MKVQLVFCDPTPEEALDLLQIASPKKIKAKPEVEEDESETDDPDSDGPTLAEVMDAFKKYVKKNDGDKKSVIPILKKLGVKSPSEIDENDYARALKLLS